jgi:hypothetical protein
MTRLTLRDNSRVKDINETMQILHDSNNAIYEDWVDEDWDAMRDKIKSQIIQLKKILYGIQEDA